MEFQAFKMRIPHDNRVRDSFAPEYHLRQNSNNTSHLNEDGNDSGYNDHITSARFNFPEENEDQQNIQIHQSSQIFKNPPSHLNQQQIFQNQQLKYLKKNIELQDYSSNGKQNLNSNSNQITQRTNQSNQTLSEQFTNTVVKDRQSDDHISYGVEDFDDDTQYQQQNRNHYIKYQQQSHYNQLLQHHQQQQQLGQQQQFGQQQKQQQYLHQKSLSANNLPQQRYIIQDIQIEKNQELLHNQSLESHDYIDNISDIIIEDVYNTNQNRNVNERNFVIQQQKRGQQMNAMNQQQQQKIMGEKINNRDLNPNINRIISQKQKQNEQYFENSDFQIQNIYQDMEGIEDLNIDQIFQKGQYMNIMQQQQINISQQQKQQQQQKQKQYQQQMIQYHKQSYKSIGKISQPYPQTILQQIKKSTQEQNIQQQLQNQQNNICGSQFNDSHYDNIDSKYQKIIINQNNRPLSRQNSDSGIYQNRDNKMMQSFHSSSTQQNIHEQRINSGKKQISQYNKQNISPKQNKNNTSLQQNEKQNISVQQIDKQNIDEHSNNTSNNEEGIVNISSIKKNVETNTNTNSNTPIRQNCIPSTSPFPFKEFNTSQNTKNNTDQVIQQSNQPQKYFKHVPGQQNSSNENKENKDTSLNRSYSENNNQNVQAVNRKGVISPNSHQIQQNKNQTLSQNKIYLQQKSQNELQINNNIFDISADENIQDTSYSAFIGGNAYFEDDYQSQNASIIKQQNYQQNQYQNGNFVMNQAYQNISLNQSNNNIERQQKQNQQKKNRETDIKILQGQFYDDKSNLEQFQDDYFRSQQENYQDPNQYNCLDQKQNKQQKQIIPISKKFQDQNYSNQQQNDNDNYQQINQNNISYIQQPQLKDQIAINKNQQKFLKNQNKSTLTTQTTQSTFITFQTQGLQKDSNSKENMYNLCNLTTEDKRDNIIENKSNTNINKEEKSNSDGEFEQIEFDQILENEDYLNSDECIKKEELKPNRSLNESKNSGKSKENINLINNNEDMKNHHNKTFNKPNQSFQPNKEEYKDIYNLLQHERNKNNSLEEKLCNKSQLILKFQKMIETITQENEQLKSEIIEKDKQIINFNKIVEEFQKNKQESLMNKELLEEKEQLLKQQDQIQNQKQSLLTQNENLQFQIEQLLDQNKTLESELRSFSQSNHEYINEFKQRNSLLIQQNEHITASKNEEIENLKKLVIEMQSQDPSSYYRKKNNCSHDNSLNNNYENLLKKQAQENGSLFDSMNGLSTGIDSSLILSMQGHPPRKCNIPSSSQSLHSKNQQSHSSLIQGANGQINKNGNSLNSNYTTVYSNQSQDEINASNSQNLCKARSSSFSSKGSDQQSLQNSSHNFNSNSNFYNSKSQQSGSQPHNNKQQQSDNMKLSQQSQQFLINFSTSELMKILNILSEKEILNKVKELIDYKSNTSQFVNCVVNMVLQCAPTGYFANNKPDLKQSWNVLKKIMNKYMTLKMNMVKDQADQELVHKIQQYLQIAEKERIMDKITCLQTENQKLTRIVLLVKKKFNFEWTQSLCELEKAIEMENQLYTDQTVKSRIKIDHLPQQPSLLTFNAKQQQTSHYNSFSNRVQNPSQCLNINQNSSSSSSSPHLRGNTKKEMSSIQTQDFPLFQQQQIQIQNIHSSTASSQRIDSANSNHIVHHNLMI